MKEKKNEYLPALNNIEAESSAQPFQNRYHHHSKLLIFDKITWRLCKNNGFAVVYNFGNFSSEIFRLHTYLTQKFISFS